MLDISNLMKELKIKKPYVYAELLKLYYIRSKTT